MAADQLLADRPQRVRHGEAPFVRRDLRQEHALEQEVADLAAQSVVIAAIDRVEDLVRFLEHELPQRLERLLVIPRAAAWSAQPRHDVDQLLERVAGRPIGVREGVRHEAGMLAFRGGQRGAPGASGIDFAGFVLSLATTAAVHFGDIPDPNTGRAAEPNLPAAGQMIEILGMLQEKTKGNLLDAGSAAVDDLLYELRLRFVQAQEGEKRIIEP